MNVFYALAALAAAFAISVVIVMVFVAALIPIVGQWPAIAIGVAVGMMFGAYGALEIDQCPD